MHYQTFFLRNLTNNTYLLFAVVIRAFVKSAYQKKKLLISQQKHMLWVLIRTVSMRPKHLFKLMDKKIITFLPTKSLHIWTHKRHKNMSVHPTFLYEEAIL